MTYSGLDKAGVLVASKSVVNGTGNLNASLISYYNNFLERFIILESGQRVGINEVEIVALKTKHSDPTGIGFKFFTPYFTLTYSGDTKYSSELAEQYKNSNILILNVPYLKKEEAKDNLCLEDAIKIIKEVNPRLAIIQHFGASMIKGDPLYLIREIQKETNIQTIAAKDGMVINPLSYSADQGQKTLQSHKEEKAEEEIEDTKEGIVEDQEEIDEPSQEEQNESEETLESDKPLSNVFKEN